MDSKMNIMESKMNVVKPNTFQVQLNKCGVDSANASFSIIKNENAENLLFRVVSIISSQLFGTDTGVKLCYVLALDILNEFLSDKSKFNLVDELKKLESMKKAFQIKK